MDTTLYLTTAEQELLKNVDATFTENFSVETEALDSYETDAQLEMRHFLADFTAYPEVGTLIEKLTDNPNDVNEVDFEMINPEIQEEVFFMIGARGMDAFISETLASITDTDDVEALAFFTVVRHKLLELNSNT